MKNLAETLRKYANDNAIVINYDTNKLEQKTRNRLKGELMAALMADLLETAAEVDGLTVTRLEKGIGISFITPKGPLPATLEITMKSTDLDLQSAADTYVAKLEKKAEAKKERDALKLVKLKADEAKRDAKRAERAKKEAAKIAALEEQHKAD